MRRNLQTVMKVLLAILVITAGIAVYRNGSSWLAGIQDHPWTLDPLKLVLSALLLAASLALTPLGWVTVCRSMGSGIPSRDLFAAWFTSQLGRYIPGKIWLFAGRAGFLKTRGMNAGRAAATTVYELLFSVAAVGLIALVTCLIKPDILYGRVAGTAAFIAAAGLLLLPVLHPFQKLICRKKGIEIESLPSTTAALRTIGVFTMLWAVRGFALFLLLTGVGLDHISPLRTAAAEPLAWLAGYIVVIVPGGIGVREAAAAALASPGAVAPAAAAIAGQRIFMALTEVILALSTSKRILNSGRTHESER
jgi:hypothetical protein